MPRHETFDIPAGDFTQLTNADATAVQVYNAGKSTLYLMPTVGAVKPTALDGEIGLPPGQTLPGYNLLSDLWKGLPGANRLWAYADAKGRASVSHD